MALISLTNGDFELGPTDDWSMQAPWSIVSNPTYHRPGGYGTWAAAMSAGATPAFAGIFYSKKLIPVLPGAIVGASAWLFTNLAYTGGGYTVMILYFYTNDDVFVGQLTSALNSALGWAQVTIVGGVVPPLAEKCLVGIAGQAIVNQTILLDEVTIQGFYDRPVLTMPVAKINYQPQISLINGNFEYGSENGTVEHWSMQAPWVIVNSPSYFRPGGTGTWAASMFVDSTPLGAGLFYYRLLPVNAGQRVTMDAWVYSNNSFVSGESVILVMYFYDGAGALVTQIPSADNTNLGWFHMGVTCTVPVGAVKCLLAVVGQGIRNKTILVDEVGITGFIDDVTFQFTYPPTSKPGFAKNGKRIDSFSTSGSRQTVLLRKDTTFPITVGTILRNGSDDVNWQNFLEHACAGGSFDYYPDIASRFSYYERCFLVETDAQLKFAGYGRYSFQGTFQKEAL